MKKLIHIITLIITLSCLVAACANRSERNVADESYALLEKVAENNAAGDKPTAMRLADSALSLSPPDTTRCWLLCEKTVALTDMGRMGEAIESGKAAFALAENLGDVDAMLNLRGALGIAYRRLGKTDSALVEYEKGIELAVGARNTEYEIYLDNCVTVMYSENNRFAEALEYARKAETAAAEAGDTIERLSARANVGGIYMRQKNYREALDAVMPVWGEVDSIGYNVLTLKHLSVILKSYAAFDDTRAFNKFMRKADAIIAEVSLSSNGVLGILEIKAEMLGRQRLYREQLSLLDSMDRYNASNRTMPEERLLSEKARCLGALGRKDEALRVMTRAYQMLDSVKQSDVEKSMSEFAVKYQTLEKDMSIEQMKRETLSMENRILWLIILVAILAVAVCILLYRRKIAAQRTELLRRRSYISGLENERERMAKELHDGVCNDILATTLLLATDSERARQHLKDVWKDVRHLSHALMPPRFKDLSLAEVVRSYVATISQDAGYKAECKITLTVDNGYDWHRLPEQQAYETYRIIQEATGNAIKHGGATEIEVTLMAEGKDIVATVANNICRDAELTEAKGIGIETMRQRADSIGGRLETGGDGKTYVVKLSFQKT